MAIKFNPFTGNLDLIDTTAAAGADTQVQFNDGGSFGGSADLTWDDTAKELGVGGDINLDDGGTYETTVQVVTATANRTISFPDATGTVALVAGSSGQLTYNNAGANAGDSGLLYDATSGSLTVGGKTVTTDAPVINLSQTWNNAATTFTGLKLNVTDTASAADSNLLDLQVNGANRFYMSPDGIGYLPAAAGDASAFIFGGTSIANASGYTGIYGFRLRSTNSLTWSSGKNLNVLDIGLARDSASVVKITDGSAGTGYLRQVPIAVASLPTAAAGNAGTRIFVSDASVAAAGNFGSVVAGGGSNTVPVYSDGGAWRIG